VPKPRDRMEKLVVIGKLLRICILIQIHLTPAKLTILYSTIKNNLVLNFYQMYSQLEAKGFEYEILIVNL
jgi:hypothetical protein